MVRFNCHSNQNHICTFPLMPYDTLHLMSFMALNRFHNSNCPNEVYRLMEFTNNINRNNAVTHLWKDVCLHLNDGIRQWKDECLPLNDVTLPWKDGCPPLNDGIHRWRAVFPRLNDGILL